MINISDFLDFTHGLQLNVAMKNLTRIFPKLALVKIFKHRIIIHDIAIASITKFVRNTVYTIMVIFSILERESILRVASIIKQFIETDDIRIKISKINRLILVSNPLDCIDFSGDLSSFDSGCILYMEYIESRAKLES